MVDSSLVLYAMEMTEILSELSSMTVDADETNGRALRFEDTITLTH